MPRGDRFHFYRLSATQGRWMHLVVESLGVRGDDGAEVTQVVEAYWVDRPVPESTEADAGRPGPQRRAARARH